ncbi:MAG: TIGR02588 family protein [Oscillatoria sp. PMC 1068.18]|nr:TIGR02588 family protein [Oscillatoria sp. PMC 1076.18]MEC4989994.1 TIGR02588 family protein [Oscillatoria sp. PMC 1068.18]
MSDKNEAKEKSQGLGKAQRPNGRSPAEWVTFSIALLIVAAIASLVVYRWITGEDEPPTLSIAIAEKEIRSTQGQYYVPFSVTNAGGSTAESVEVIAQLRVDGEIEEIGSQEIEFLSSGEVQQGAFVFSRDPNQGELIVRVASYKLP